MKRIYISGILAGIALLMSGCYSEDKLYPTSEEVGSRYDFPEGDNSWDSDAIEIAEKFNVYMIYKNIGEHELNRSWEGTSSGYPIRSYPLNDERAEFYMNFMKDHIFAYLNPELTVKVLPTYIFLAYDVRQETMWTSYGLGDACWKRKFDGMDFWAFCLEGETPGPNGDMGDPYEQIYRPVTPEDFWLRSVVILLEIVKRSVEKGNIVPPEGFAERFDFSTQFLTGSTNIDDPNFSMARGFPEQWYDPNSPSTHPVTSMSEIGPIITFCQYINNAMIYTREQMQEKYSRYPVIIENYDYVVNYLKTKYNWDVAAIAKPF